MQDSSRTAGFSPQLDSVNEVRVDVFGANASYGDTSGGTVNITTKGGANKFHGSEAGLPGCRMLGPVRSLTSRAANHCTAVGAPLLAEGRVTLPPASHQSVRWHHRRSRLDSPGLQWPRQALLLLRLRDVQRQPPTRNHRQCSDPGGTQRRLLRSARALQAEPTSSTIPTTATGTPSELHANRHPGQLPGRPQPVGTDRPAAGLTLSPIALAYLKIVPLPNYNGATTTADGQNNYFTYTPTSRTIARTWGGIDYNIGAKNKIWGRRTAAGICHSQSNYFHNFLTRHHPRSDYCRRPIEDVHTFSPTLFLDVRGSVTRYDNPNTISPAPGSAPPSLGFPGYLAQNSTSLALPADHLYRRNQSAELQQSSRVVRALRHRCAICHAHQDLRGAQLPDRRRHPRLQGLVSSRPQLRGRSLLVRQLKG